MKQHGGRISTWRILAAAVLLGVSWPAPGRSQSNLTVADTPDDWGTGLTLNWEEPAVPVIGYEFWRFALDAPGRPSPIVRPDTVSAADYLEAHGWQRAGDAEPGTTEFLDSGLEASSYYSYVALVETDDTTLTWGPTETVAPTRQWLRYSLTNILVAVLVFMGTVVMLVERARRGAKLFIRRIAGLEAVEEAVGRATEMGRPILYIPGLDPMDEVATVAAIDILGQVAKKAGADYVIDASEVDPVERVNEITHGEGVDVSVEAIGGTGVGVQLALGMVRHKSFTWD